MNYFTQSNANYYKFKIPRFIAKLEYNNKIIKSGKTKQKSLLRLNDFKFGFKLIAAKTVNQYLKFKIF
jgi:hypothetical protein